MLGVFLVMELYIKYDDEDNDFTSRLFPRTTIYEKVCTATAVIIVPYMKKFVPLLL